MLFIVRVSLRIQYLRYLKQFFQIVFKIENVTKSFIEKTENMENETDEEKLDSDYEDELQTGSPKIFLTAVGIGYHNLTKTLI